MKTKAILAGFVIITLLIGFSSGNFVNLVYADDDNNRDDELKERAEKYKEEQQKRLEKSKKELQQRLEKYREETGENLDKYGEELKEKQEKYRDRIKEHKHEIELKYKELKTDYKEQFDDLKDGLKEMLRELTNARLAGSESSDSNLDELTEDKILDFEEKRKQLENLKKEFREKIRDLKTQARQDISTLKQDYLKHDQERRDKIHDKLSELKLKFKERIKEHRTDLIQDGIIDYVDGKKVLICHIPPGNPDNAHTISVSVNAVYAHFGHDDSLGYCGLIPDDETGDDGSSGDDTSGDGSNEATGTLKIKKITLDGEGDEFNFAVTSNTTTIIAPFALNTTDTGMNMTDTIEVIQGSYNITEALPDDWNVVSVECNGNLLEDETVAGGSVNVTVAATETVECIFTNEKTGTT